MKHDLWRKGSESLVFEGMKGSILVQGTVTVWGRSSCKTGIPNEQALGFLLKWIFAEFCNKTILENTAGFLLKIDSRASCFRLEILWIWLYRVSVFFRLHPGAKQFQFAGSGFRLLFESVESMKFQVQRLKRLSNIGAPNGPQKISQKKTHHFWSQVYLSDTHEHIWQYSW